MQKQEKTKRKNDFLVDVYKLRIQFYSEFTSRMWTRFNFLLTTETAILGFFLKTWIEKPFEELFSFLIIGFSV